MINNTRENLERLNIEYTKKGIREFLLSTRFLFQSLDRVQFYNLSGNLIGDTNILDLDPDIMVLTYIVNLRNLVQFSTVPLEFLIVNITTLYEGLLRPSLPIGGLFVV